MAAYLQSCKAIDHQTRDHHNAGRSKPIELLHGKPGQCGKDAKVWRSPGDLYLDSVNEKRPVLIVVTYLRGDTQTWWFQVPFD